MSGGSPLVSTVVRSVITNDHFGELGGGNVDNVVETRFAYHDGAVLPRVCPRPSPAPRASAAGPSPNHASLAPASSKNSAASARPTR